MTGHLCRPPLYQIVIIYLNRGPTIGYPPLCARLTRPLSRVTMKRFFSQIEIGGEQGGGKWGKNTCRGICVPMGIFFISNADTDEYCARTVFNSTFFFFFFLERLKIYFSISEFIFWLFVKRKD